jgi:hypothetical protein
MRPVALALLLAVTGCKSSEQSSSPPATTPPTPSAAPVTDDTTKVETAPAPTEAEPANALEAGAPVRKAWGEGGPGEVVWKVDGGSVTLRAEPGKPEGTVFATFQGKQQHVTNFPCDTARAGSEAAFSLTADGKVIFRAAVGASGKDPGQAVAFLLEWKPDKSKVFVANGWQGTAAADPPPWARL